MKHNFILSIKQKKNYSETFYDLEFYFKECKMFSIIGNDQIVSYDIKKYKTKELGNCNILFFSSKKNNYYISQLYIEIKCMFCGKKYIKKGQHVMPEMKLEKLNCTHCNCSNSHKTETYIKNYKQTMLDRYGFDSPIKVESIAKKIQATMMERYGAKFSAQSKVIRAKFFVTMIERYGKKSINTKGWSTIDSSSKIERKFVDLILQNIKNYDFIKIYCYKNKQFFINEKNKFNHSIDFFIKDIGYCLEVDGDFWHGNLKLFDKNLFHPIFKIAFENVYKNHLQRIKNIKTNKNIKFLRNIWASNIEKNIEKETQIVLNDIKKLYEKSI